jgi:hypothetical protein
MRQRGFMVSIRFAGLMGMCSGASVPLLGAKGRRALVSSSLSKLRCGFDLRVGGGALQVLPVREVPIDHGLKFLDLGLKDFVHLLGAFGRQVREWGSAAQEKLAQRRSFKPGDQSSQFSRFEPVGGQSSAACALVVSRTGHIFGGEHELSLSGSQLKSRNTDEVDQAIQVGLRMVSQIVILGCVNLIFTKRLLPGFQVGGIAA